MMLKNKYCDASGILLSDHPSIHQFRYFYRKHRKLQTYYISRDGLKSYQRKNRPLLGNGVQEFAPSVGTGMLDSTICDIYLVNESGNLVGRPILTACVDAYSGLCCGYSLSWEGGVYSLRNLKANVIADKVAWCRKFGISIQEEDWNCNHLPATLVTDMGNEYKSSNFEQIAELGVTVINLPPYFDEENMIGVHTRRVMAEVKNKNEVDEEMKLLQNAIISAEGGCLYAYHYEGMTFAELAENAGINAEGLQKEIERFSSYAGVGDAQFGRNGQTIAAYPAEGPYHALKMIPVMLNTQGGARRNENAEVLDTEGNPIPHLYSAGEFGGICANQYQGGGNIAEVIIFGQIAGTNAAAAKEALSEGLVTDVMDNAKYTPGVMTDIVVADYSHIALGENEYLGIGEGGMGGSVVCKVKIVDGKIEAVEVVEHKETPGISDPAIANVPGKIIEAQSVEVDGISGATLTSNAIKNAVFKALEQVK